MQEIQQLRKIAVKLDVSGTVTPIAETRLYKGGYGFVALQCYVPVTQNRSPNTRPLCTVSRTTVDNFGNRKQFNRHAYNLLYVDDAAIANAKYMVFECPLPKAFTDTVGDLEMVFAYSELDTENEVAVRLASGIYRTTIDDSDVSDGETVDPVSGELARLNDITVKMEGLEDSVDALLQSPDNSDADKVGTPSVSLTEDGRLKFSELKGEKGDTGELRVGRVRQISYDEPLKIENSGTSTDAVIDFEIPQGKPALVKIGKVVTLPPESEARVENVGTDNDPVLDIYIPEGVGFRVSKTYSSIEAMREGYATDGVPLYGFAIIETGNVNDEDNAKLYCKGQERYEYLTDLSGAQGFKGETGATPSLTASVSLIDEESRIPSAEVQVDKNGAYSPEAPLLDLTFKNIVPKIHVETKAGTNDVEGVLSIESTMEQVHNTNDYNLTLTFNNVVGGLTKQALGLDNVDNTADVDKPVSTATQEKLNEVKADVVNAQATADNALPLTGGTLTGALGVDTITGATMGDTILRQDPDSGRVVIGSTQRPLKLIGNSERPKYSNAESGDLADTGEGVALLSDLSELPLRHIEIDATGLDDNTWYPVTFQLNGLKSRIRFFNPLFSGYGNIAWSTHTSKTISYHVEWTVQGDAWGANPQNRRISEHSWKHCDNPFGMIGQLYMSSEEFIYVRGGAKYNCYVSGTVGTVALRTTNYTSSEGQTLAIATSCNTKLGNGVFSVGNIATDTLSTPWGRSVLKAYHLTSDGDCVYVGAGAQTVITGGESAIPVTTATGSEEQLYLESNYDVYVYSNTQNGIDSAKVWTFGADGNTMCPGTLKATQMYDNNQRVYSSNNPMGFMKQTTVQGWGNQIGTFVTGFDDSTGGSIAFRRDNPTAASMSMIIDGTVYVNGGHDRVYCASYPPVIREVIYSTQSAFDAAISGGAIKVGYTISGSYVYTQQTGNTTQNYTYSLRGNVSAVSSYSITVVDASGASTTYTTNSSNITAFGGMTITYIG